MRTDHFFLSLKNLKHRGLRTWLTLLGIFIGVTVVIALIGLGNGLKLTVEAQFGVSSLEVITVQAGGLNLGPPGSGVSNPLDLEDLEAIQKVNNVDYAIRRNLETLKLEYNDHLAIGTAIDLPEDSDEVEIFYTATDLEIFQGRRLDESDNSKILLGYNFVVDKVGLEKIVEAGDTVKLENKSFEVAGILAKKGSFVWDNIVVVPRRKLDDLANFGDEIDMIVVVLKNTELIDKTQEDIESVLRKTRDVKLGEEDFDVSTPAAALETVNEVLTGVQIFIVIIASLSVIIGAIGIINTMTTSVMERRKDIGIMKAIGAKNSDIFLQFLIEAGLLGLIGGLAGIILGTAVSYFGVLGIASFLGTDVSPDFNIPLILITLAASFIIGAASGIIPAIKAAKQNPVEVIRG
jgi:putative ABC transport system permease protein